MPNSYQKIYQQVVCDINHVRAPIAPFAADSAGELLAQEVLGARSPILEAFRPGVSRIAPDASSLA